MKVTVDTRILWALFVVFMVFVAWLPTQFGVETNCPAYGCPPTLLGAFRIIVMILSFVVAIFSTLFGII